MKKASKIPYLFLCLLFLTSCATNRLNSPVNYPDKLDFKNNQKLNLYLENFSIENSKTTDIQKNTLITNFLYHLHQSADFNKVVNDINKDHTYDEPMLLIDVKVSPNITSHRTYYLDLIFSYPIPYWFGALTPEWGTTYVELEIKSSPNSAIQINPINVKIEYEYDFLLYSWFRAGGLDKYFMMIYQDIFTNAAKLLQDQHTLIISKRQEKEKEPKEKWSYKPDIIQPVNEHILHESKESPQVVRKISPQSTESNVKNYLKALGGLEYTSFSGIANVNSKIITSMGSEETIASGSAASAGYKISLSSPPQKTGFYLSPTFGYFFQKINIADFSADFQQTEIPNVENIPIVASDPKTGIKVDADSPNVYDLELKSTFIGQKIGHDLLIGFKSNRFIWFISPQISMNIAEYRTTGVKLGAFDTRGNSWEFFKSGELILSSGIWYRPLNLCFKVSGDWNFYKQFKFPQKLYFKEMPSYYPEEQIFIRKLTTVDSAYFDSYNFLFSVNYVF